MVIVVVVRVLNLNLWLTALLLFSCWVLSDSLWPRGLQRTRLPCSSLSPGVYPNLCPLCRWCHPTVSSRPLVSPAPPALHLSQHKVFSSESALRIRWPILCINLESESITRDSLMFGTKFHGINRGDNTNLPAVPHLQARRQWWKAFTILREIEQHMF